MMYVPGSMDAAVSASIALTGYASAWLVLPRVLRAIHRYVERGPTARLLGRHTEEHPLPYDMSVWGALEEPTRLVVTVVAFAQLGSMVAPSTSGIEKIWRGGTIVSFVWFLHRWKASAFSRFFASQKMPKDEKERYLALDNISTIGLIILGAMALAEASGVAVQSILTVGGIGGFATAFAARDIIGNALSGLALQFLKPFSVGDSISAGPVEGQVTEIGLHSTKLLNADKFPVIVPNSIISSQVIVNRSRPQWQSLNVQFPVRLRDIPKLRKVKIQIVEMLRKDPRVFLEQDPPRCHITTIGPTPLQLCASCNIKPMGNDEAIFTEEELTISIAEIIMNGGVSFPDITAQ